MPYCDYFSYTKKKVLELCFNNKELLNFVSTKYEFLNFVSTKYELIGDEFLKLISFKRS